MIRLSSTSGLNSLSYTEVLDISVCWKRSWLARQWSLTYLQKNLNTQLQQGYVRSKVDYDAQLFYCIKGFINSIFHFHCLTQQGVLIQTYSRSILKGSRKQIVHHVTTSCFMRSDKHTAGAPSHESLLGLDAQHKTNALMEANVPNCVIHSINML